MLQSAAVTIFTWESGLEVVSEIDGDVFRPALLLLLYVAIAVTSVSTY